MKSKQRNLAERHPVFLVTFIAVLLLSSQLANAITRSGLRIRHVDRTDVVPESSRKRRCSAAARRAPLSSTQGVSTALATRRAARVRGKLCLWT